MFNLSDTNNCIIFTNDGKKIISAGLDNQLIISSLSEDERLEYNLENNSDPKLIAISSDDNYLVLGYLDQTIDIWDFCQKKFKKKINLARNYLTLEGI